MQRFFQESTERPRIRRPNLRPAQVVVLAFALAILVGSLLLSLPLSHAEGRRISFLDALFTATSAVCVTGLIVVDTGSDWSRFGQTVIMLLIKSGGLGILTLGALLAFATGRRLGFQARLRLQTQANTLQVGGVVKFVRNIVFLTLSLELMGALLLYIRFSSVHGYGEGAFYALFHSISALNNAGFSLYATSLMAYVHDPLVNLVIACLFILGGLGFMVVLDLYSRYRQHTRLPFSLHSKLVLSTTAVLLLIGTIIILMLEWANPNTLGPLSFLQKVLSSFFQAATPRTAGFNTVDYSLMNRPTLVFTMLLMFIGASPGSTGGGVKTTTFLVLLGSAWAMSHGRSRLVLFSRRIAGDLIIKAAVISTLAMMLIGAAFTALTITEPDKEALALAFEVVSAFGTVGLSMGVTADLSSAGKAILIALMLMGRIGLLTFALALVQGQPERRIDYPAEDVVIG